ncbi:MULTISPECIES: preprotein translocase subunit SecG [Asticcacaulis]|uniref:preprotein translocase subunit SecG n=1 Tax=Asticcacaulis TaxID=76890 RepID=UPI001AE9CDF4|nr:MULTISPECIES: preprotein translocase subunit SecG [Asticcacaulis]MBP2158323.1 preprotein translocase subunit SecG [Asticcacaulis solisilvae]MDR6799368.1 preprotein translocase subunit SecG [Asticcacaulis sp. BE141]
MLLGILLTVQILISVIIIVLVLIQRSEGGALGMGGGPSGFMSARGAGNLLTKATSVMGILFFVNCIGMTVVGNYASRTSSAVDSVDTSSLVLPGSPQTANSAQAPAVSTASSAAPSLNDLPLAGPVATPAPAASQAASRTAPAAQRPVALPAPLSSSASSQAPRGSIFANTSSSAAAPASTPTQP